MTKYFVEFQDADGVIVNRSKLIDLKSAKYMVEYWGRLYARPNETAQIVEVNWNINQVTTVG